MPKISLINKYLAVICDVYKKRTHFYAILTTYWTCIVWNFDRSGIKKRN